jgi:hypothetical protein
MRKNDTDVTQISEVRDFMRAEAALEQFKEQNSELMTQLSSLTEDYNQKLEAAEKVVRAKKVSCGPFEFYQEKTTYDPKTLFDSVGRDRFLQVGGITKTVTEYSLDKERVKQAIAKKDIPKEVVEAFVKVTAVYHKPDKITL